MINQFNIRVYALCVKNHQLLTLLEYYAGEKLIKLPGGGLEYGEGVVNCLKRELKEELNLEIKHMSHFYTQEDFLVSKFRDNEQLLAIYYKVELPNGAIPIISDKSIEEFVWVPISGENPFILPVDRLVFELLRKDYCDKISFHS